MKVYDIAVHRFQATHHSGGFPDAAQWDEEQGLEDPQPGFRAYPQGLAFLMAFADQQGEGRWRSWQL